jgi:type IV pilus assembly protein PilN
MRVRINLLPHREAKRERQKRVFYAMTAMSVVAGFALIGLVWTVLQGFIANQEGRNAFIAEENRKLDTQIKEIANLRQEIDALRARQRAVEDLQADRNQPVHLFSQLNRLTPEGIYLRSIKQEDRKVSVVGWAASNERVSEYLRNLQNSAQYIERSDLIEIKISSQPAGAVQRRLFEFSLSFVMRPTPERVELQSDRVPQRAAGAAPSVAGAAVAKQ